MSEVPEWFNDEMKNGVLIVGIYFKVLKDYVQNEARKWLSDTLCRELMKYIDGEIEGIEYALTRYISQTKVRGKAGKAKGGEYKYSIRNANPEFYRKLFEILEEKKRNGPEWFGDYYVLIAKNLSKEVILSER